MSKGEEFLKDNDLIQRRSAQRRQVLACMACRWVANMNDDTPPDVYGYQILECSKIKSGVLYPILRSLEDVGVVISQREDIDAVEAGHPPRRNYSPAATELGQAFAEALEPPSTCQLVDELK